MVMRRGMWLVIVVTVLVFGSAHIAWRYKPPSTLIDRSRARISATLAAEVPRDTWAWRMVMEFRRGPAATRWVLHEGAPGSGYEIHWQPDRLAFEIFIASGDQVRLLGSAVVAHGPRLVEVRRRGLRLDITADNAEVLAVIDGLPAPATRTWGFQAAADLGEVVLSLHDDRRSSSDADKVLVTGDSEQLHALAADDQYLASPTHALAQMRLALLADPDSGWAWDQAQRDARLALRALGDSHPDAPGIDAWLAWSRLRGVIRRSLPQDLDTVAAAIESFTERVQVAGPALELNGLLLDQIARLAARLQIRPPRGVTARVILQQRTVLLTGIEHLGLATLDLGGGADGALAAGSRAGWMLRLVVHAAGCLRGGTPQPTPAEGPGWLADRWRAFAGSAPRQGHFRALESAWLERDPLAPAVDQLIALARFEPFAAMALTEQVREQLLAKAGTEVVNLGLAIDPTAARQAAIIQALLALRGHGDRAAAVRALQGGETESGWVAEDPLAFALDRLLQSGLRRRGGEGSLLIPGLAAPPESLRWAEALLNGQPVGLAEAWRLLPERPMEGIAAALIMQELAGTKPDWALLEGVPHFTVPLALVEPPPPTVAPPGPVVLPEPPAIVP